MSGSVHYCGPEKLKILSRFIPDGDWRDACKAHDIDYMWGGDIWDKLLADVKLWIGITACGWRKRAWYWKLPDAAAHCWIGAIYFLNAVLFGAPCFAWRKAP